VALAAGSVAFIAAGVTPAHPLWLIWFAFAGGIIMSLVGVIAAVVAEKFDQMSAITNFIVTPLSFLSGTFYSVSSLPAGFQAVSRMNPIFYLIDGFRFGALGVSDASPWVGFAVTAGLMAALWAVCWRILSTGWRLKS
jgi:ABC-2 type transport system permease protein